MSRRIKLLLNGISRLMMSRRIKPLLNVISRLNESKARLTLITGLMLALLFGVALFFRVYFPYDVVFGGQWIKFSGADAYYQMRVVDNIVHNFPHLMSFDPYLIFPGGAQIGDISFFNRLLATIIWVIGLGSPTVNTVDIVGVYFPAVLGALAVIPVFFIGKELFGRWAGILAAALIAILPGEFLGRSILGFTDHHVAEVLFTTVAILFLLLAIKAANQQEWALSHLKHPGWGRVKPVIYSLLAGSFLGIYMITWQGGLLFVFIIFVYLLIQFIIDHLKQRATGYLSIVAVPLFLVAAMIFLPVSHGRLHLIAILAAILMPPLLNGISRLMTGRKIKPLYYPAALLGLGLAGLGILYLISPSLLNSIFTQFSIFNPRGVQLTTIEMQPILFPSGTFSLAVVWGNFNTSFYAGLIALGILIYLAIRQGGADKNLLLVWSLLILAATLGQRRFAYYFAVNIALLAGYVSWLLISWVSSRTSGIGRKRVSRQAARREARQPSRGSHNATRQVAVSLTVVIIFFVVYFTNIFAARDTATQARFAPSDAWLSSLLWMKENTPEPFADPDFYYHLETDDKYRALSWLKDSVPNPTGDPDFYYQLEESYKYPDSAYGVLAWWDYGYWITRIAHRMPNANPGQEPKAVTAVASFFTSQDEASANEIAQELKSSYVVMDYETSGGKFWAVAKWAGKEPADFFDVFPVRQENELVGIRLYYPAYYRSLATRLYNFNGEAVIPESTLVIAYEDASDKEGNAYHKITGAEQFDSYQEAENYISSQESGNYRVVGTDPFVSPVPLEALENYRLVYSIEQLVGLPDGKTMPAIKIFERLDEAADD